MAISPQATPDIAALLSLFTSKSGATSGSQTQTTKSDISKEGMDALLRQILESDRGVASIVSGEKKTGLYNSTTNQQLLGDFLTRAAGELAVRQAGSTTTSTSSNRTNQGPTLNPGKTAGVALAGSLLGPSISAGLKSAGIEGGIGGLGKSLADLIFGAQGSNVTDYRGIELPPELRGSNNYDPPPEDEEFPEADMMVYPDQSYGGFDFLFGSPDGSGD